MSHSSYFSYFLKEVQQLLCNSTLYNSQLLPKHCYSLLSFLLLFFSLPSWPPCFPDVSYCRQCPQINQISTKYFYSSLLLLSLPPLSPCFLPSGPPVRSRRAPASSRTSSSAPAATPTTCSPLGGSSRGKSRQVNRVNAPLCAQLTACFGLQFPRTASRKLPYWWFVRSCSLLCAGYGAYLLQPMGRVMSRRVNGVHVLLQAQLGGPFALHTLLSLSGVFKAPESFPRTQLDTVFLPLGG